MTLQEQVEGKEDVPHRLQLYAKFSRFRSSGNRPVIYYMPIQWHT